MARTPTCITQLHGDGHVDSLGLLQLVRFFFYSPENLQMYWRVSFTDFCFLTHGMGDLTGLFPFCALLCFRRPPPSPSLFLSLPFF